MEIETDKYKSERIYDGVNSDMGIIVTYIGSSNRNKAHLEMPGKLSIKKCVIFADCKSFYEARKKNYKQMISDFLSENIYEKINVDYYPPFLIVKDDHIQICHVKVDEVYSFRFVKFYITTVSNEMCFHNYVGDIHSYFTNELSTKNGYSFITSFKNRRFKNLENLMRFYIKKAKLEGTLSSTDNIVALTENISEIIEKYLPFKSGKSIFIKNLKKVITPALFDIVVSRNGNFVYIVNGTNNLQDDYDRLIPTIENSYDIIKEYLLINFYLEKKYLNYDAKIHHKKELSESLVEINDFYEIRENLLNSPLNSVSIYIKAVERVCQNCKFHEKRNILTKYIKEEIKMKNDETKLTLITSFNDLVAKMFGK